MKSYLYLLGLICLLTGQSAFAQDANTLAECRSLEDSLQYLKKEFVESGRFVGKPAKEVFQALKATLPIESVHFIQTSPWIDPEGIAYLQGTTIYSDRAWREKLDVGEPYIRIQVYFEETKEDLWEFEQSIPREYYATERMLNYMEDFVVKEVHVYISKNRFPTRKK